MKKANWKTLLSKKLEVETSKSFDDLLMKNIRSEMKQNSKKASFFQLDLAQMFSPALALGLILFIFISSHNNPLQLDVNDPTVLGSLIEQEVLLDNLTGFSEIEGVEKLSDADWDILLTGI